MVIKKVSLRDSRSSGIAPAPQGVEYLPAGEGIFSAKKDQKVRIKRAKNEDGV